MIKKIKDLTAEEIAKYFCNKNKRDCGKCPLYRNVYSLCEYFVNSELKKFVDTLDKYIELENQ